MKAVKRYNKGGKQKGTARAGRDYTNDRQAMKAGVEIDYSDPFRNISDKDKAFIMKNVSGYSSAEKARVRLGAQQDGGYFSPESVANMRKSLLKGALNLRGTAGQGKQKVGGMPQIAMSPAVGYKPKKEKTKERIDAKQIFPKSEERQDNTLIRTGDKNEIRKEVKDAFDAERDERYKK